MNQKGFSSNLVIFVVLIFISLGVGVYAINSQTGRKAESAKYQAVAPSPISEIININSEDDPELGLAGYSSGPIKTNGQVVQMRLLAPDRKKVPLSSFPCEQSKEIIAVSGTFRILALDGPEGPVIDKYILGEQNFVMNPADIEQNGLFSKKVNLNNNPIYEALTLAFRKSCFDTEIYFFSFNDKIQKIIRLPFVKKDKNISESILIPKGLGIPQIDDKGYVISSSYNSKTTWRDKTKYKFNLAKFQFEEVESYSQPK